MLQYGHIWKRQCKCMSGRCMPIACPLSCGCFCYRDTFAHMGIAYHYVSCIEFEKPRPLLQAIIGQLKVPILPAPCILISLHGIAACSFLDHNYSQSICAMTIIRLQEHTPMT